MLGYPSIEILATAKKLEMEALRSGTVHSRFLRRIRPPSPKEKVDILVKVAIQPKFSVAVTLVRGIS